MKMMSIFLALVVGTINFGVRADEDDISPDQIREMVARGEILPLNKIMSLYPESNYGKLLDLQVKREYRTLVYELEFLRSDGWVIELEINAQTGQLLEQEMED